MYLLLFIIIIIIIAAFWSKRIYELLDSRKLLIEIIGIILAISAIYFPLKEAQKANELAYSGLELGRRSMRLTSIPFLNFRILEYVFDENTTRFLVLEIENFSDAPALFLKTIISIDKDMLPPSSSNYGDLMPHEKREVSISMDSDLKKKIFNRQVVLGIDLAVKDLLGNIYHNKKYLDFEGGKFFQKSSYFCGESDRDFPCQNKLDKIFLNSFGNVDGRFLY